MKAVVERKALAEAMTSCRRAVDGDADQFLMRCADDRISITGTDLNFAITTTLPATLDGEADWLVPADLASGFVTRGKADAVTFSHDGVDTKLQTGRSVLTLACGSPNAFPSIAHQGEPTMFDISSTDFRAGVRSCLWAVAEEGHRAHWLCGIHVDVHGGQLRFVGANGWAAAIGTCLLPDGASNLSGFILPTRAAKEAARLAGGSVTVSVYRSSIEFSFGDGTFLSSKLVEGAYPEFSPFFDGAFFGTVQARAADLSAALSRIALTTDKKRPTGRGVKVTLGHNKLVLERRDRERGSVVEDLEVSSDLQSDQEIGLNAEWFRSAVDGLGTDDVSIGIGSREGASGVFIRAAGHTFPAAGIGTMAVTF